MEIPKQLQDRLTQYQSVQNQLQMIMAQKQHLMLASADTENALKELGKAGDGRVYKMAGTLLIETTKDASQKELSEAKETGEARITVIEKQEKKLRDKFEEMRKEISAMLGDHASSGASGGSDSGDQ